MDSFRGLPANAFAFGLPVVFALLVSVSGQWWSSHAFDTDEGINLGKAALVAAGFHPYADIWNDQPPLLTYVLAFVQELFPWSVSAARVTILFFACLLLYAVFAVVKESAGKAAAVTSVVLLATAPLMWRLSISVMIGLPAVALAMSACAIVYRRQEAGLVRGVVAGLVFALSLQTKLFTAAAFPAFLAMAYLSGGEKGRADRIWMAVVAMGATAAGFVAIEVMVGVPLFAQLISPHVGEGIRSGYSFINSALRLGVYLIQQPFVVFSALLAVVSIRRPLSDLQTVWLIWIGCTFVALLFHTPIRYHHVFLLLVPMACLGGEALWRFLTTTWPGWSAVARYKLQLAIGLPIALVAYLLLLLYPLHVGTAADGQIARLLRYAEKDPLVATDQPFEAFRARLLVLPELVVFSKKRIQTHRLTAATLIEAIDARRPGQVMLRKDHADRSVLDFLDRNYVRVHRSRIHYVRPDIVE